MWYLGEGMLGPLLAVFTQKIGGNILDISWAWAIYLIFYGVLDIIVGKLADKVSKEKLMILGYGLNALFTFAYILVHTPMQLFAVQAALGIAAALATPTWDALYDDYSNFKSEGMVWGVAVGTSNIVTGVSILIGGMLIVYASFTMLFIVMGCIQLLATVIQSTILIKNKMV